MGGGGGGGPHALLDEVGCSWGGCFCFCFYYLCR